MIGKLKDLTINRDGTQNITVTVQADFREEYDELDGKEITVEIKKYSKRRSLDANAYCWSLVDRIAEKMRMKKSEVYRNAIKDIGGVSTIICVKDEAVASLCNGWSAHGLGWFSDTTKSKLPGCTNVTLYYGSSCYDTRQMSMLIDSLVQDAESIGISTITEKEKEKLLGRWTVKQQKKTEVA